MDSPSLGPAGGKGPNSFVPKPRFEYKAPSMLAEHKYLAIAFIVVVIAASIYLYGAPRKPLKLDPPPAPPVYVEPINVPPIS